jgi:hypothetical protein
VKGSSADQRTAARDDFRAHVGFGTAKAELAALLPRSVHARLEATVMHWSKFFKAMRLRARLRKLVRAWRKMLGTRGVPEQTSDPLELAFSAFKDPLALSCRIRAHPE